MVWEIKLFNTATKKKEQLPKGPVGIYVCGITPYDITHLGHAFTFITYDVLVRYLRARGRQVTYVQNVTDIDDDILLRAKTLGINWRKLACGQTAQYLTQMGNLQMIAFDHFVKATDHIGGMVALIKKLIAGGYAYVSRGNVYFAVRKDGAFGQRLCHLAYDAMLDLANERGNFPSDPNKNDPLDFVLWQAQKEGEPFWPSPWGPGRPGWHIECSAMSTKYLDQPVTIHGGGADLKFPHHEAEISQSEKATGHPFVRHWVHTAMVYCGEKKMSKSLGNMIFVRDLLQKYEAVAIRWYLLSHHYRSEWNYNERELATAAKVAASFVKGKGGKDRRRGEDLAQKFWAAMAADLDTPEALKILTRLVVQNSPLAKKLAKEILGIF